jgi:hypothetical protein
MTIKPFLILFVLWCLVTGFMDLDWMIVSYRYSEWHRSVEFWEFCPFVKVNWWIAYVFSLVRIVFGVAAATILFFRPYFKNG